LGVMLIGAGWIMVQTLGIAPADQGPPVVLPQDPQKTVLLWDVQRPDLQRKSEAARVVVRADGTVTVTDPYAASKAGEVKLSLAELQVLLRSIIHEHGFFRLDEKKVSEQVRAARGVAKADAELPTTVIRVCADNREQELRCTGLRQAGEG